MDIQKLKEAYEPVAPSPGGSSFFSQFYGLFVKRVIWFKRDHSVAVIGFVLPIMISIGAAAIMQQIPVLTCDNPAMLYSVPLTLDLFTLYGAKIPSSPYFLAPVNSKFLVATSFPVSPTSATVAMAYSSISSFPITDSNLLTSISANRGSIPGALNSCCSDLMASSSSLNAFYNAALLHSLPSTLTTAYSSLLFSKNGGTIICQSWPLPQPSSDFFTAETGKSINGNMFGNMILALALGTALGSLVVNPVVERANRSKFLQVVSGVRMSSYWAATFVFDFCIWMAFVSIYIVILQIFKVGPFTGATAISLWIIMLISGAATLLMVYCWSFKLATPSGALGASTAGLVIFLVVLMIGWLVPTTVIISNGLPLATSDVLTIPYCIGIAFVVIFPPLSMMIGSSLLANMIKVLCSMGMKPDANATFFRIFVAINICQILAYTIILFILEASSRQSVTHSDRDIAKRATDDEGSSAESDVDVKTEQIEILAGHRNGDHVVARSLRQEFVSAKTGQVKVAVAGISFSVKKGEVLGILGPNGAGKTSTLSILTCDHMPSSGTYAVCGHDATDLDAVRRCIGVCPQHDALFMHMTPTENIYLFARLRGIPENKISQMCDNLLGLVKMQPHAHVLCGKLSGGNKRKISLVVSLIGAPPAIFMDEPSSGMDIIAKRFFWRVIEALRKEHAIILTTHSMEEAESVCSRVGIIVDGKLRCLGSLQRIKSVYGTGYDVQLKPSQLDQVSACKGFMLSQLPASILVEEHGTTLKYTVPREAVSSVSSIFETVGKLSRDIGMSEFGVCQTSLEQVFLHFGKQQRILSGMSKHLNYRCVI
jgi:ATP-binding cassette subfamily A (ABC1) protein 3